MKKQYDIIYSIGADCACAIYLNKHGLRKTSGPFDWLTNAPFTARTDAILNDFAGFFDGRDIKLLPRDENTEPDYDYYENTRNGFYYYHDFPVGTAFKDAYANAANKYARRISRFKKNLKARERVLLIWLAHNHVTDNMEVKKLCDAINTKYNKTIDFILIENDDSKNGGEIETQDISPNITKYKMVTLSLDENGRPTTLGNEANCNSIFEMLEIRETFYIKFANRLYKPIARIICVFVPDKDIRRMIKNYRFG